MYVNLYFEDQYEAEPECFMDCISCGKTTLSWISTSDYGSHVFCGCYCGGIFVIDCLQNSEDKNWEELDLLKTQYPPADRKLERIRYDEKERKIVYSIKVPLIKIDAIVGSNLSEYHTEFPLDEKEIRKIYENGIEEYKQENPDVKFLEDYPECETQEKNRLFVTCNSYDIMKPAVPYPKNIELDHDGVVIVFRYNHEGDMKCGYITGD